VLLDYLPAADDEAVEEEAVATLLVLGVADGKVDPALVAALQDHAPERRAAAALVVGRYGGEEQRTAVRKLLNDGDVRVRFRAAQGLLAARDKSAVPVLAAVLSEGPAAQATQAHDLLECMAGSNAPRTTLGDSEAARRRCRDAWEAWWKVYGPRLDLAKADVDLPANNPALQTRVAARRFLEALMTGDSAGFVKTTDAPFTLLDVQTFATRNEVDNYFLNTLVPGRQKGAITFKRVQSAEEYAKHAAAEHKDLLKGLTKPEVRAVTAQAVIDGQPQNVVVFVRLANGQAHVVGCGQDKTGAPRPPGM
jgi:HEAT repeats